MTMVARVPRHMKRTLRIAVLAALVVLSSCASEEKSLPVLSAQSGVGTMIEVHEMGSPRMTVEGSQSFLRLQEPGGDVVFEGQWRGTYYQQEVEPGSYELTHWLQSCDGSCDELDEPSDMCSAEVNAEEGKRTRIVVDLNPKGGCKIGSP